MRRPSAGVIVHVGEVISGQPKVGDQAIAEVDMPRRHDIMRNHTATHLLHAALHTVLGEHARQAGSLVAPDRLRFDFNHPEAMTPEQIETRRKDRQRRRRCGHGSPAQAEGARRCHRRRRHGALRREIRRDRAYDYDHAVGRRDRRLPVPSSEPMPATCGPPNGAVEAQRYSYELCGGTHLERTSDVGVFLIVERGLRRRRRAPD